MRRRLLAVMGIVVLMTALIAAVPASSAVQDESAAFRTRDDRSDPATDQQRANRQAALEAVLLGKADAGAGPYRAGTGQYIELEREGEDTVWTVLGEFGDFPHNNIAEPDRSVDNSTLWEPDFSRDYFLNLLFDEGDGVNSVRQYFIEQSSNRYTVNGDVTDWTLAPNDACTYDDDLGGPAVWQFLVDTTADWYQQQLDAGMDADDIDDFLSQYDTWDRYDWDEDANFDEPDGYIDRIQFVFAGEGNEAGGGALGDCAIWSHSWYAYYSGMGDVGPSEDFLAGGFQIGDSSYWVGKYTIQPENGGVGVFTHEFSHDLGIPDLYDYTGENSVGFWSLMASGSWLSLPGSDDIGSAPDHLGVWEKFQLGWLNFEVAYAGDKVDFKLGPAEYNTRQAQGLFVVLPDKEVIEQIGSPYSGEYFYYSGQGNDLDNWMYMPFTLGANSSLDAMVNYQIEVDWDYAYVIVSTDGGANWETVETNLSTTTDPNEQNFGFGITGSSGGWVELTADLSDYTGDVLLGFRYWTDVAAVEPGFMVDDIAITGYALDDAEGEYGWTFDGFWKTTGVEGGSYFNAYVAEFRQYRGYDAGLSYAYNFGWVNDPVLFNYVEHFPYQDGLLISYWDGSFPDNNVGSHCAAGRCGGLLLPVDAHPELMYWKGKGEGGLVRNRLQTYDATFGLHRTDAITLHRYGIPKDFPSQPANPEFNDLLSDYYYNPKNPMGSVLVPQTGTVIEVKSISTLGSFMQVEVRPAD